MQRSLAYICLLGAVSGPAFLALPPRCAAETASVQGNLPNDLTSMSIEELMNIEVTSVSRKVEYLNDAAAAVFVITQDDIRRSGATSIPDVLRMAPGLDVARIDANKQAISSRGFNGRFARKMLVLLDGRTIYTPLFSGVWWDRQDMILEDIERIEVIRGPGATLWGANAVNGVINIITKKASDTVGSLVTAGGGNVESGNGGVRYGVKLGSGTNLRVFAKYLNRSSSVDSTGREAADGWHTVHTGFRLDYGSDGGDAVTVQGDAYDGKVGETYTIPVLESPYYRTFDSKSKNYGGSVYSRWKRTVSETSDFALQMCYDRSGQTIAVLGEKRDTFDLDFQHRFNYGKRQGLIWGLGYRFTHDKIDNTQSFTLNPDSRGDNLFSAFVQDDIAIITDKLRLTLGSKFEHNDYTGFEVQPNIRTIWTPNARNSVWAAVSRAVRTPSRAETDGRTLGDVIPPVPPLLTMPMVVAGNGSKDFKSEELTAYEIGCRVKPKDILSFDFSTFFNQYRKLYSLSSAGIRQNDPAQPQYLILAYTIGNKMDAETYGFEAASDLAVRNWWRIHSAYTFLEMKTHLNDNSIDLAEIEGRDPHHQFSLRSQMDLWHGVEFDVWLRYVDELSSIDVERYVTPDVRLGWKPFTNFEISLVGRNLTHHHRREFKSELINTLPTETERTFFGKITWTI